MSAGTCPKCAKTFATEDGLIWCEGCGYEPPESASRPALPSPADSIHDDDLDAERNNRKGRAMTEMTIQSADQLAAACTTRIAEIDRELDRIDARKAVLRDERVRLGKVVTLLLPPKPGAAKGHVPAGTLVCEHCGKKFVGQAGLNIHFSRVHALGQMVEV